MTRPYNNKITDHPIAEVTSFGATVLPPHNALHIADGADGAFTIVTRTGDTIDMYGVLGSTVRVEAAQITVSGSVTKFVMLG